MKFRWSHKLLLFIASSAFVYCSQGVSELQYGAFKDSNVEGLTFNGTMGSSGTTGPDGIFSYIEGDEITFSVGNVYLGTLGAMPIITPLDLIHQSSTDSGEVLNIVRLLMFLDSDGDASNGIQISASIQKAAESWGPIDFAGPLHKDVQPQLFSDVKEIYGQGQQVPSHREAKEHLQSTLRCIHSGAFIGTFEGGNAGSFGVWVDAKSRQVLGAVHSTVSGETSSLQGLSPVSYDYAMSFSSGTVDNGATFRGNFRGSDSMDGTWENEDRGYGGSFSGERVGGSIGAKYRFTGKYITEDGSQQGLFALDVDEKDQVSGVAYNVTFDALFEVSGILEGETFSASISDGSEVSGILRRNTGEMEGSFLLSNGGVRGSLTGSGCRLN